MFANNDFYLGPPHPKALSPSQVETKKYLEAKNKQAALLILLGIKSQLATSFSRD